jgi:hypothetical protein
VRKEANEQAGGVQAQRTQEYAVTETTGRKK